jgi:hypothetical protein
MAGYSLWVIPCRKIDLLQLVLEIMIVIEGYVGVDPAKAKSLEQMRLPEVADIIIDAAGLNPARYRPDIADQYDEEADCTEDLQEFHLCLGDRHFGNALQDY